MTPNPSHLKKWSILKKKRSLLESHSSLSHYRRGNKPKIAIINLTSCSGCLVEIINLSEEFLDMLQYIEIANFPLVKDEKIWSVYDIAFIEGSPITLKNIEDLKKIREKSKFLVALGACACLGGIPEIKNYRNKDKLIKKVYRFTKKIDNPQILPLKEYIKVDFEIPGCPPNKNEFAWAVKELLAGKLPKIPRQPVCYECQIREYECLLQKGLVCLGPITLAGCEAICLRSKEPCSGCRGIIPNKLIKNQIEKLKKIFKKQGRSNKELNNWLEKFGLKDDIKKLLES